MQLAFDIFAANGLILLVLQARSSVGERFLDTEEAGGSIPPVPIHATDRQRRSFDSDYVSS